MIVVTAIETNGGFAPEIIPIRFVSSLFDGTNFIYFETAQEQIDYLASLQVWNKEAHIAEINALHEQEFKRRLFNADYVAEWELNAVLADSENEYFDEAVLIINYWWNGWDAIKAYSETVTEENFIDPQTFVDNLENI
jgi:hypothetical protein